MPLPGDGTAGSVVSGWLAEIWDTQDLYTVSDVATLFSSEKSWDVSRGFLLVKFQAIWAEFRRCQVVIVRGRPWRLNGDSQCDADFWEEEGSGVEAFLPCGLFCCLP
ncbi:hypothetical protein G5714_021121 [Onychostoma macrolepis]|uniref:Uncharacterized protein n=1 Tax=Onychostoma macrolepis TaxID=369639 RepID=A0A7J6BRL4_9TELE|nr:hypothetical protein G5714_021121 [Onychostoma macrolepis]